MVECTTSSLGVWMLTCARAVSDEVVSCVETVCPCRSVGGLAVVSVGSSSSVVAR